MRTARLPFLAVGTILVLFACSGGNFQDVLRTLLEKERLVTQARYQLLLAASATKNAVLATSQDAAAQFAGEARNASNQVEQALGRLGELVRQDREPKEATALAQIKTDFGQLQTVAGAIWGMVGRNTNLRASVLSHTEATQAVGRLEQALARVIDSSDCPAAREALRAVAAALTLLSLEDRHIDLEGAADMDRLETAMAEQHTLALAALDRLAPLLAADAPTLAAAREAWNTLWTTNATVVRLSRENSNINALVLTMGRSRQMLAQTLDDLEALHALLQAREFTATR